MDYEGELALVIGRRVKSWPQERWLDALAGVCCANDVSARDLQKRDGQFARAKSFDTFCPVGPAIVAGLDPSDLAIETRVNGDVRQSSRTSDMVFSPDLLVAYISRMMTLLPGDLILTGHPAGVGPLSPGDFVEVEMESRHPREPRRRREVSGRARLPAVLLIVLAVSLLSTVSASEIARRGPASGEVPPGRDRPRRRPDRLLVRPRIRRVSRRGSESHAEGCHDRHCRAAPSGRLRLPGRLPAGAAPPGPGRADEATFVAAYPYQMPPETNPDVTALPGGALFRRK